MEDLAAAGMSKVEGSNLFEEEWDNLIVLDGCRADLYEEVVGESSYIYSSASCTPDYIRKTFTDTTYEDVVYVSGNPWFHESSLKELTGREEIFHSVFDTFSTDWSEDENTVLPEPLVRDAKTAKNLFEGKKLVVHFMQPHQPFVNADFSEEGSDLPPHLRDMNESNVWDKAESKSISREKVYSAYRDNLEFVMPYVEELVQDLDGKTVITSDHGNLLGEGGLYGHPCGKDYEPLKKVPWDVRESE
ncbi:MAG: hypothetical protein ABEJ95_02250 [Candidatus Nanohalobium sp.]